MWQRRRRTDRDTRAEPAGAFRRGTADRDRDEIALPGRSNGDHDSDGEARRSPPTCAVGAPALTRVAAITPAHRDRLRTIKGDFDRAYASIPDIDDRTSREFREAEALYRLWIKAIDAQALALLDDLDAFDIGGGGPRPEPPAPVPRSPVASVLATDVDHVFAEMEDILHARDLIGEPDGREETDWPF